MYRRQDPEACPVISLTATVAIDRTRHEAERKRGGREMRRVMVRAECGVGIYVKGVALFKRLGHAGGSRFDRNKECNPR